MFHSHPVVFLLGCVALIAPGAHRLDAGPAPALWIDASDPRQSVDGFGASTAWFADDMQRLTPETFDEVNRILWGSGPGAMGLNIHRIRVLTKISHSPEVRFDWDDETFLRDVATIKAIQDRYDPLLLAVPWTPPAWMKDTGEWKHGGRLKAEHYRDYAEWLAEYILTLRTRFGVEIDRFSVQNEPGKKDWESCEWTKEELATFIRDHLKPVFDARGIGIPIMINEETAWHSRMLDSLLEDPVVGEWIDIAAAHLYWGSHQRLEPFHKAEARGKRVWMTEFMLENHLYPEGELPNPLERAVHHAMVMCDAFEKARVNAYLFWWAISTRKRAIQSLLQADFDSDSEAISTFDVGPYVRTFAHYARFVEPGDRVLIVTDEASVDGFGGIAFVSPDHDRLAVVCVNRTDQVVQRVLRIRHFDAASLTPFLTDATHDVAPLAVIPQEADGGFPISLPPVSVLTVVTE